MPAAAGFWSYVRKDNQGDDGRMLALADDLRAQYRLQTAEELELFVDHESIQWGQAWEERIVDAIAGTTFFIPVVTPSYFRSNACRQELLRFIREAERLGLEQLLLTIYWVLVPDLEVADVSEAEDEAIRAVGKYQRQDFREVRFEDRSSSAYRKSVSALASEIAERAASAETVDDLPRKRSVELDPVDDQADEEPGIMERIATGEVAMEKITQLLGEIGAEIEAVGQVVGESGAAIQGASKGGQGMKAVLVLTDRLARDLGDPTERIEKLGREYAKGLSELDPGVHAWLDLVEGEEEPGPEQVEYLLQVEGLAEASDGALKALGELVEGAKTMSMYSRSLRKPANMMRSGLQGVLDGRAIIEEWARRAREIRGGRELQSGGSADQDLPTRSV
jgi:hypothetical protein